MTTTLAQPAESPATAPAVKRQEVGHWSPGGQVFFTDDKAFGINKAGATVCLGKGRDVEQKLSGQIPLMAETVLDNIIRLDFMGRGGDIHIAPSVVRTVAGASDSITGNSRVSPQTPERKDKNHKASVKRGNALQAKKKAVK